MVAKLHSQDLRACRSSGGGRAKPPVGGEAVPAQRGGRRLIRYILREHRAWLREPLADEPDITPNALRTKLAERGLKVSL